MGKGYKPTVCVDLNGVLDLYTGWQGEGHWDDPRPGAAEFLAQLERAGYRIVIHSTKNPPGVKMWLQKHGLFRYVSDITDRKVPAVAYIDDRAIRFDGVFEHALKALTQQPHWKE